MFISLNLQIPASGGLATALVAAALLGLRHATDADHLTAVATLMLQDSGVGIGRAGMLGLSWGLGHALTLLAFGVPVVWLGPYLPAAVQQGVEVAIGLLIVGLAVRLLVRWRRGYFHTHEHAHDEVRHAHPHVHEHPRSADHPKAHGHEHAGWLARSPAAAFGVGLVHGIGGSAVAGVLLVAAAPDRAQAIVILGLFALTIAGAMGGVSAGFGYAVSRTRAAQRLGTLVPALGAFSLAFGVWYALNALSG